MGELFSADVDDLDHFVTTSTGQVQALSTALSTIQGQRVTLASAPLPDFVDATTTDRLDSLLAFLTENERFVADIADALVWHGDHLGRGTYLASVDAIQAELDNGQDQRLQQIEDQLVAGGIDPTEAAKIRAEIEGQLTADPTLAFGDAVVAGFAAYQGVTVEEAERAARAFTLHPAEVSATLEEHFNDVASRSGQDHLISLEDLHDVIADPDAPPELRDAAYRVAADGTLFLDLDTAHQTDLSDEPLTVGFAWHRSDELIGRDDLREFPAKHHQAQILLAWHPLIDTANQGYDLDRVDSHVSADDVIAFVEDDEIPLYIRLAVYDVYAERHDLDVERRVELEQELAFAPGGGIGGVEVLDASRVPSGPGNPLLVNPGTGPTTAPRTTAPPVGGGGGRAAAAAIIAQLLVTSVEFGWNQGRQAAIEDAGNPRFVFTDPLTGVRTVIDPSQLSHLSPDQLRAWVAHQAATGQPPAELTDQVAPHRYRDVDGQWRLSDTNEPVWSGDEPGPAVLLEPTPPPGVYVDANGHWRYLHDGHLWDGYLLSPTEREELDADYWQAYDQLGAVPPRVRVGAHDAARGGDGAHTGERHGPDIPLRRTDAGPGERTIEGRIYGDAPWPGAANGSHRWLSDTVWQRVVQNHVDQNWETIRHQLAEEGQYVTTFDAGNAVGEGFYSEGSYGAGPTQAVYHQTSFVTIRLRATPGTEPGFVIVSAFPTATWP